jgi:heme A synthase
MLLASDEIMSRAWSVAAKAIGIWFIFWAIRKKGEFDRELDITDQTVRWLLVSVSLGIVTFLIGTDSTVPRITALIVGLAFLCWPNLAYYLGSVFRRGRPD